MKLYGNSFEPRELNELNFLESGVVEANLNDIRYWHDCVTVMYMGSSDIQQQTTPS